MFKKKQYFLLLFYILYIYLHHGKYQCHLPASCTYHLPMRAIRKSPSLNKKCLRVFWGEKSGEWTISRKITRQSKGTGQKNKGGGRNGESYDSPEIVEGGMTHQTSPASLWGKVAGSTKTYFYPSRMCLSRNKRTVREYQ